MLASNGGVTFVESGDEHLAEVDRPDAVVDLLEPDGVRRQGVGDEKQARLDAEGAGRGDARDEEVARILDRPEPGIVRTTAPSPSKSGATAA